MPRRLFVLNGPRRGQEVYLTFDDGPDPEHTPPLLDVLRDLGVPATFFVIGERAARHPEIVRRMAREGHAVGHHSYHHEKPDRATLRGLAGEASRTRALLRTLIGTDARLFRPPHGSVTAGALWRLWGSGHTVVLWSADPKDYAAASADAVGAYFELHPLRGGDVVLLHDTRPHAAAVLPTLVARAQACGLSFRRIPD
ncbi:MAG TPA: polysaccharide deacetylase family protein, partial [Vicinamibacteria bacterium]|nr:polysaccharide deacetylase family protein [Vicinamibacteria bacterium]